MAKTLMLQGTASHVGKSVLTAALCRIFRQEGLRVAPFKAQNMALNAAVTGDGLEIGRAQALQAQAAGVEPIADMNPILLKPKGGTLSQVVVMGRAVGDMPWGEYSQRFRDTALDAIQGALTRLLNRYDLVVMEGAGSPAEVNLKSHDLANMTTARLADAPVLLVADIERGGIFASVTGTLDLLDPEERKRVKGIIVNKFRGDSALFEPGARWLEDRTGLPVLGVIPFLPDLGLDEEDSLGLPSGRDAALDIAVIRLPHLSNFNDFDPLAAEPEVGVRYVDLPERLGYPDAVILPGTKNTVEDLRWLYARGLAAALDRLARAGVPVAGICGGYQMLGHEVRDESGVESSAGVTPGLALLPVVTSFEPEKRTALVSGSALGTPVRGYEIHMGRSTYLPGARSFVDLEDGRRDGAIQGETWGTYLHGIFDNGVFRRRWLNGLRGRRGMPPLPEEGDPTPPREAALNRLADHVRRHLAMDRLRRIVAASGETAPGEATPSGATSGEARV